MYIYTCTFGTVITLGVHAQEGYSTCFVCLSVCLSVTTLAAALFISTIKLYGMRGFNFYSLHFELVDFQKKIFV